jgi:hypothetical protein
MPSLFAYFLCEFVTTLALFFATFGALHARTNVVRARPTAPAHPQPLGYARCTSAQAGAALHVRFVAIRTAFMASSHGNATSGL